MHIAVNGCSHGELDRLYGAIAEAERARGIKVDLLLCCGDFQAVRNPADLRAMAIPPKYYAMNTFWKYYKGELAAPVLTIVIGGNHEASNYFAELPYGGWLAPNIYFLGYAGVVCFRGLRIGGISGIYKGHDFLKGRFEFPPYSQDSLRSTYHQRNFDVFRLKQLPKSEKTGRTLDIFMSHDWPRGVPPGPPIPGSDPGFSVDCDTNGLLRRKKFLTDDIRQNRLGSPALAVLMKTLRPKHWFCGHLHVLFGATVRYPEGELETKFLAIDKPLPGRRFLEIIEVETPSKNDDILPDFAYDPDWLAILANTDGLMEFSARQHYMPGPTSESERYNFKPTEDELKEILENFPSLQIDQGTFVRTAATHAANDGIRTREKPEVYVNQQTVTICERLGIPDWFERTRTAGLAKPVCSANLDSSSFAQSRIANERISSANESPMVAASTSVANPDEISLVDLDDPELADEEGKNGDFQVDKSGNPGIDDESFQIDRDGNPSCEMSFAPSSCGDCSFQNTSIMSELMSFPAIKTPDANPEQKKRASDEEKTPGSSAVKKFKRRNASIYDNRDDDE